MVLEAVVCTHCQQSQSVKRHGTTKANKPRYRCGDCGRSFLRQYTNRAHDPAIKRQIFEMALNGSGVRDTARVLRISPATVCTQLKKK